ncbi:MAG: pyruvate kinase [Acidobacteriota bacterium]|nr:pyruvate kinase [Acidobacteriota bacterium]
MASHKKRTKIICTMGPATEDDEVLRQLILHGMNVARFNFSHGSHEYHRRNIERVRRVSDELSIPVAILLDTKGPEIRTGELVEHKPVMLEKGERVVVTTRTVPGSAECFSISYHNLPDEVSPGSTILVDDGLIELTVDHVDGPDIYCVIRNGGMLSEHKGINVPNVEVGLPSVTEQDRADIMFGCEVGVDAIAASFIRSGAAVDEIRKICAGMGMRNVYILSKIESATAVKNFDEILQHSDGIMVARGDLGVEMPAEQVPHIQKLIISKCASSYKPVIVATQMLDSMTHNPRPTRAEVGDVANAVYDGADCVMLSGETAAGKYPIEAVKTMSAICKETERYLEERQVYHDRGGVRNVNSAIGFAAVEIADRVGAKCIICPSRSGRTARLISNFRPDLPIYAMSPSNQAIRKTCFLWGVFAYKTVEQGSLSATLHESLECAKEQGLVKVGDVVVITSGDPQTSPQQGDYVTSTNMAMVAQVQ